MKTAVVIPVGPGREQNMQDCLAALKAGDAEPDMYVAVLDGDVDIPDDGPLKGVYYTNPPKHEPGREQPRNRGVRTVQEINHRNAMLRQGYQITHVWFLDSDVLVGPDTYAAYLQAMQAVPNDRILVGPYEWMPAGMREIHPEIKNDGRWVSFDAHEPNEVLTDDLSAGLACFGGNLIWPLDRFVEIGGFWDALYHGRCEDGELGLRAVACGVPISFVAGARGYHMDHPVDFEEKLRRNERDVPMLNERHPWVEGRCVCGHQEEDHLPGKEADPCGKCGCEGFKKALFVVEEDGKRFNVRCACGWEGNSGEIWEHQAGCDQA